MTALAKKGQAPCGHPGTYVTPSFITCDLRCEFDETDESDGVPTHVEFERTRPICPYLDCDGGEIVSWPEEWNHADGRTYWLCRGCGKSFHA